MRKHFGTLVLVIGGLLIVFIIVVSTRPAKPNQDIPVFTIPARLSPPPHFTPKEIRAQAAQMKKEKDAAATEGTASRKLFAQVTERTFLSQGQDAHVTTSGAKAETLHLSYVLIDRAQVYLMINDVDTMTQWRSLGFTKVVFSDGYDHSWSQDLTK